MLFKYLLNKTQKLLLILACVCISLVLVVIAISSNTKEVKGSFAPLRHDIVLKLPKGSLYTHIATSKKEQETGLSYQRAIDADEGMLFIFEKPGRYGFWMKDMNFPIDILWISEEGRVVHIEENVTTSTFPEVFTNEPQAKYVLEVNSGGAKDFGLFLGTKIDLTGLPK